MGLLRGLQQGFLVLAFAFIADNNNNNYNHNNNNNNNNNNINNNQYSHVFVEAYIDASDYPVGKPIPITSITSDFTLPNGCKTDGAVDPVKCTNEGEMLGYSLTWARLSGTPTDIPEIVIGGPAWQSQDSMFTWIMGFCVFIGFCLCLWF